jgi:hypothetical protein
VTWRSPDPDAAERELVLANAGDKDAARQLLLRVALGEFDSPAVQLYLSSMAAEVRAGEPPARALRLTGKRKAGEGIDIARAVLERMAEGLTQNRAVYLVHQDRGVPEAKVRAAVDRYRADAEALAAYQSIAHLFKP